MSSYKKLHKSILVYLSGNKNKTSAEIKENIDVETSQSSVLRVLQELEKKQLIKHVGNRRSTTYSISPLLQLIYSIDVDSYFKGTRECEELYNFELMDLLDSTSSVFTDEELYQLEALQQEFKEKTKAMTPSLYKKNLDNLFVEFIWKSAEIEGNTYSLIDTDLLLNYRQTAKGKNLDEALMIVNHKEVLDQMKTYRDYVEPLSLKSLEELHAILLKDLDVDLGLRTRIVRITGTKYTPLLNQFQIKEELIRFCSLINKKKSVFDKALLTILLLSYIQGFNDGNKRLARVVSNGILLNKGYCPLSFAKVSSEDFKKAILIFYEQNNISAFKSIFMEEFEAAVKTYF